MCVPYTISIDRRRRSAVERTLVDVCRQLGVDVLTSINGDGNETTTLSWLHRRRMLIVSL